MRVALCYLVAAGLFVVGASLTGADEPDSVDRNYQDELPRVAAKSPQQALATFKVADGFKIDQVAAEPLVTDPVAMSFDENGRLYVVEMRGYSEEAKDLLGRIRVLTDNDNDGHYDKSQVLIDGLAWPTAIICYDGGVFVGAAPDLHYFKDTTGDGKADHREVVWTGFGRGNVQGLMNSLRWGLDNRIHGATSSSGASITKTGSDDKPLVLRGRDFAFNPKTRQLTATSGGGQHGMSFSAWGEKFVCSNSNHAQAVLYDDRYVARNPYLAAPSPRVSIAADGPQADVYRSSPVEPWRIVRTRLRKQGIVPGPVERGGKAAGYFTGATGITMYRGDNWPAKYYGWAIVGDVGSNLVHRKRIERRGVGFVARRVDEKSELLTSTDIWFRPVQFANAPDGGLYILDMYREVIEHPLSLHPVIKKHLDLTSGRDRGRLYRLISNDFQQRDQPRLGSASTAELVATLDHANGWHRETAARLLYQRGDSSAIEPLEQLARKGTRPEGRFAALYALQSLDGLTASLLTEVLGDPHPRVREHAVRLSEPLLAESPVLRKRLTALVDDSDIRVRYQLAFSVGELPVEAARDPLVKLARRDGADPYFRAAILSSLHQGAGNVLADLASDAAFAKTAAGKQWLQVLAAQIGKQQRAEDVAALLSLMRADQSNKQTLQPILTGLALKPNSPLAKQVAAASGGRADAAIGEMLTTARGDAGNVKLSDQERADAVKLLRLGKFSETRAALAPLLQPTQPLTVQAAALGTLGSYSDPAVATLVVERWSQLSPAIRRQAAELLQSRPAWIPPLLTALESNAVPLADLEPGRLRLLAKHEDPSLRARAEKLLKQGSFGKRSTVIEDYQQALTLKGDVQRGQQIFKKNCSGCHRVAGVGHTLAPSLAAMKSRGSAAILSNVLDPNREVNPLYLNYTVITEDGRSLSGMIAAETATSMTLKRADNASDTVLRIDIDILKSTGMSLMPEGFEKQIDEQSMADLLEFLRVAE